MSDRVKKHHCIFIHSYFHWYADWAQLVLHFLESSERDNNYYAPLGRESVSVESHIRPGFLECGDWGESRFPASMKWFGVFGRVMPFPSLNPLQWHMAGTPRTFVGWCLHGICRLSLIWGGGHSSLTSTFAAILKMAILLLPFHSLFLNQRSSKSFFSTKTSAVVVLVCIFVL